MVVVAKTTGPDAVTQIVAKLCSLIVSFKIFNRTECWHQTDTVRHGHFYNLEAIAECSCHRIYFELLSSLESYNRHGPTKTLVHRS